MFYEFPPGVHVVVLCFFRSDSVDGDVQASVGLVFMARYFCSFHKHAHVLFWARWCGVLGFSEGLRWKGFIRERIRSLDPTCSGE